MDSPHYLPLLAALGVAALAACSGETSEEGARPAAASADYAAGETPAPTPDQSAVPAQHSGDTVASDTDGLYPQQAAPDATPPVAAHPTRIIMLADGLYAQDANDNWRKLENGTWITVQAPQLPAGTQ